MLAALSLILFALVSTAFLAFLGYGPAKLLLPREWRTVEGLLAPLLGYTLLLLLGYYSLRAGLSLNSALYLALGLGLVLSALAVWRRRGEGLLMEIREHGLAWLIGLAAFLLAVLPLLSYGYNTVIGENWDPENYLPVTDALVQGPVSGIAAMPPNPLRELNASPPRIGLTLGFSILQGVLQQLHGWDALRSFAPTLALLYGLTSLALYVLFRQGFAMGRWAGLLATLSGGLYALALWIAFFNFGMQMAALPLLPLALALWLAVLRQPSWRTVLLAALGIAALPVAYYPALTVFVPLALGLGLYELIRAQRRPAVLLAGFGTALLAPAIAWGTILDYGAGFSFRYSQQMTTLGLFAFPSWSEVLGLAPFSRTPQAAAPFWNGLQVAGLILLLILAAAGLVRSRQRWLWLSALVPAGLYIGWLRGWFWTLAAALPLSSDLLERLRPYPYAFLKGVVFVVPLLLALAVAGWEQLGELAGRLPWKRIGPATLLVVLLLPLLLILVADGRVIARYWGRPAHFDQQVLSVEEAVAQLPAGATVYLTGRPERSRLELGLWAYFLRTHPLSGRLSTGYGAMDYRVPGDAPSYALLDAGDNPYTLGFSPAGRAWAGSGMVLYRRDPAVLSFLDLRDDAYSQHPSGEIHTKEPLADRLLQSFGVYPALSTEQPLVLYADAARLSRSDDLSEAGGSGVLALSFAAYHPATVTLRWDDGVAEKLVVPAGFSVARSQTHPLPGRVEITTPAGDTVWACWAALLSPDGEAGMPDGADQVLALPETTVEGPVLQTTLRFYNPSGRPLRLVLEVGENSFEGAHHYAWWGPLALPERGRVHLQADLARREADAAIGDSALPFPAHPGVDAWPAVADGSYFAALWVYYGTHIVEVLPVAQFRVESGAVQDLQPLALGLRLLWPHSPAESSGARFGPGIALSAYERGAGPFAAGDSVPLALEWQSLDKVPVDYSVSVQIQGPGQLWGQWDGPAGQWYPTTAWQPGQHVRDDIPLQVAPGTPAGRYRLVVVLYDPATRQRLPVRSPQGQEAGDTLDLGEIVVR